MLNRLMTPESFDKRLHDLKQGNPPDSMVELSAYVSDSLKELRSYTEALAECVQRQKFTQEVIRKLNKALEAKNRQLATENKELRDELALLRKEAANLKAQKTIREGGHL